ncbi:MAG: hypothetical protein PHX07_04500 [Candidatus Marinimicrobia bacterium]|jgi:phage-related minor tail protein|nr:hypothetical protein [Candidatus Neomarinimicrobiota bacterium]
MPERSMNIIEKRDLIVSLGTAQLIKDIKQAEADLEQKLNEELQFRSQNGDYVPGRSDDCSAVRKRLMELQFQAPKNDGKKMTVDETKAWLEKQRTEDNDLAEAIQKQKMAEFTAGDLNIKIDMLRTKLNDLRAILALRTSQITFFSGDVRTTLPLEDEIREGGN